MKQLINYIRPFCRPGDIMVVEKSFYQGKANWMHLMTLGVLDFFYGEIETIAPASVKKYVTGSGKATKQEVKNSVIKKLSDTEIPYLKVDDEDAVDAVAIGLAFMERLKDVAV